MEFSVKNLTLGTAVAAAGLGLWGSGSESSHAAEPVPVKQSQDINSIRSASISGQRFSGALTEVRAPEYDGPVHWALISYIGPAVGLGMIGVMGGVMVGVVCSELSKHQHPPSPEPAILLGLLAGAASFGITLATAPKVIEFETTVSLVSTGEPGHYERHGKTTSGPYFSQMVTIPECPILLASNMVSTPMMEGQKIKASFAIDDSGKIIGWFAEAGDRPNQ